MNPRLIAFATSVCALCFPAWNGRSSEPPLRQVRDSGDAARASLRVHAGDRSSHPIPTYITGKFAEHLGWNIYNGMDAQILRNPTFADYPFRTGPMTPDGVARFQIDDSRINEELRRQATRFGWPASELDALVQARSDALACLWTRVGAREAVQVSPDTGPDGGRAQRVEVEAAGQGIAQWTWLPLHRQRQYELEIMARSPDLENLTITLGAATAKSPENFRQPVSVATASLDGLSSKWKKFRARFTVPAEEPSDASYRLALTANAPGQFVVRHVFLRPADHVHGADPDIIRLLKESHLPILRWPGGNFASTYHWEDGIGPMERRPTKPNYAWGGLELNTFGTDEFIAFCRAVGCEPMICLNAGSGTPDEAARWIEYCNSPATSPMGKLRAENGHPEPFRVKHWEVGNELWGKWQMHWTSASGYVDRFKQFAAAIRAADPNIEIYSCGAPAMWGKRWNDTLIAGTAPDVGTITDHPLIGGSVSPEVEPLDVYRDFMAVPEVLERKWAALRAELTQAGVREPRLAVTELQLFAHLGRAANSGAPARLTRETLPSQASLTEAIYDVLIYHAAIRLAPFVEMVTHSAIVNHGGGLRKERERVWANPCHYAQAAFAAFAGATPVPVEIEAATERAPLVLPDLRQATKKVRFGAVDALAALANDGSLLLSIVHRGTSGPIRLAVELEGFQAAGTAQLHTLTADKPWLANTLEAPEAIKPVDTPAKIDRGRLDLELQPFTVMRVQIPRRD